MAEDARKFPKFPWDYDIPNSPFWSDLEYTAARNFSFCYSSAEISNMNFDSSLSIPDKLGFLRRYLNATLRNKEKEVAPPLHEADFQTWFTLKLAMCSMEHGLGNHEEQERLCREMMEKAPETEADKKLSAQHQLAGILEITGRYAEAEILAKSVLLWMQEHELLGKDSPQALSSMRMIASCIWKQERYKEGGEWMDQYGLLVSEMLNGKFQKYQDSEKKMYVETKRGLWEWRRQHGRGDKEVVI